jgi:hypothetical protein
VYLSSTGIMLNVKIEQCVNVKFLTKLGKSDTETHNLLMEVYGDECLFSTQVSEWFIRFKEGRGEIEENFVPSALYIKNRC